MRTGKEITIGADGIAVEVLKEYDDTLIPESEQTPTELSPEDRITQLEQVISELLEVM